MHVDLRRARAWLKLSQRRDQIVGGADLFLALAQRGLQRGLVVRPHAPRKGDLAGVDLRAFGAQHEQHVVTALVGKDRTKHGRPTKFGGQPLAGVRQGVL